MPNWDDGEGGCSCPTGWSAGLSERHAYAERGCLMGPDVDSGLTVLEQLRRDWNAARMRLSNLDGGNVGVNIASKILIGSGVDVASKIRIGFFAGWRKGRGMTAKVILEQHALAERRRKGTDGEEREATLEDLKAVFSSWEDV